MKPRHNFARSMTMKALATSLAALIVASSGAAHGAELCRDLFAGDLQARGAVATKSLGENHLPPVAKARLQRWNLARGTKSADLATWLGSTKTYLQNAEMVALHERVSMDVLVPIFERHGNVLARGESATSLQFRVNDVLKPWTDDVLLTVLPSKARTETEIKIRVETLRFLNDVQDRAERHTASLETWLPERLGLWLERTGLPEIRKLSSRTRFDERRMRELEPGKSERDRAEYERLIDETVEVFYSPSGAYGHTTVRVGRKWFSLDDVLDTRISDYTPNFGKNGKLGFLYRVPREEIARAAAEVEKIFVSSRESNIPPYELFSGPLEITLGKKPRYASESPNLGNRAKALGDVVERDGRLYLASNLIEVPITKVGDRYFVDSYSCSTMVTHVLRTQFGIGNGELFRSVSLAQSLLVGSPETRTPDYVIWY